MKRFLALALLSVTALVHAQPAEDKPAPALNPHLKVFEPFLGKVFKGEFANSTPDKPMIDVMKLERAMNGEAVRILHSVNDGAYGGETILIWDQSTEKLRYWYFTTGGFHTTGTMEADAKKWTASEKIGGNAGGVSEVRSVTEILGDGKMTRKAEMLRDGKWGPGHTIKYVESPKSEVKFK